METPDHRAPYDLPKSKTPAKLRTEIRDQLTNDGKIERRLRRLADIDPGIDTTIAGAYRLEWLQAFID